MQYFLPAECKADKVHGTDNKQINHFKVYQKNNNAFEMLKMTETCSSTISGSTELIMFGKCLRPKL